MSINSSLTKQEATDFKYWYKAQVWFKPNASHHTFLALELARWADVRKKAGSEILSQAFLLDTAQIKKKTAESCTLQNPKQSLSLELTLSSWTVCGILTSFKGFLIIQTCHKDFFWNNSLQSYHSHLSWSVSTPWMKGKTAWKPAPLCSKSFSLHR